jgi:hypothetical protein
MPNGHSKRPSPAGQGPIRAVIKPGALQTAYKERYQAQKASFQSATGFGDLIKARLCAERESRGSHRGCR